MKRRRAAPKYAGALARPIAFRWRTPTILDNRSEARNAAELMRVQNETEKRLELLFAHFGIAKTGDPGLDYRALALELARAHVPGFRLKDADAETFRSASKLKRGNFMNLGRLLADLEVAKRRMRITTQETSSDTKALDHLTTKQPFAKRWGRYRGREDTLQNWLAEARDKSRNPWMSFWEIDPNGVIGLLGVTKQNL